MHHHHHDKDCGCGRDHTEKTACGCGHEHTHDGHCGHGHDHEHTHDAHCGCGCSHAPLFTEGSELTDSQADVLLAIHQRGYLPVARFAVGSSKNEDAFAVALSPVYISNPKEDMETVKATGAVFAYLEDSGLITLDYDLPLKGYAYEEYHTSDLYAYFLETVKEAAKKEGFAMDTPILELGSMALTEEGLQALKALMDK